MTDERTVAMLVVLSAATFLVTSSGSGTAPFIQSIATDLGTGLPAIAHLFSVQSVAWGTTSLFAGLLSDRFGRRPVLVAGVVLLGATRLGFAAADTYAEVLIWQMLSGVGGGAFMGGALAAVSDHVPAGMRGRALSWVIMGQSLSLVLGVPAVTLLGALGGWRAAIAIHGVCVVLVALAVRLSLPADRLHRAHGEKKPPLSALLQPHLVTLLTAGTTERVCFATFAVYLPTVLQRAYAVSFGTLAIALGLVALGNLAGNLLGGRLADRTRSRSGVFARTSAGTALLAMPALMWHPGLTLSVALGFAYSFVNAVGRPSLMAALSQVPSELRGALFGINVTMASLGWLLAGSVGATLIATGGLAGLGIFCTVVALLGSALALASGAVRRVKPE